MAKIIEQGRKQGFKQPFIIVCPNCGCKAEYDYNDVNYRYIDYGYHAGDDDTFESVRCPNCDKNLEVKKGLVYDDYRYNGV